MDKPVTAGYPDARNTGKTVRLIRGVLAALFIIVALYGFLKITDVQIIGNVVYRYLERPVSQAYSRTLVR